MYFLVLKLQLILFVKFYVSRYIRSYHNRSSEVANGYVVDQVDTIARANMNFQSTYKIIYDVSSYHKVL